MGLFHHHRDAYDTVVNAQEGHQAHLSHELIAAAAAYEAEKAWGEHREKITGEEWSHPRVKEFLAASAAAFAVNIAETKGRDFLDRDEVERQARNYIEEKYTLEAHNGY